MIKISKTFLAFFVFGLVNNVLYVIILTAAHDLVSPTTPKSVILLADILPAFLLKLALPIFVNKATAIKSRKLNDGSSMIAESVGLGINYPLRLLFIVLLSSSGMFITSLHLPLYIILMGIIFASLSSGLGETTFLQLSHYYNHNNSNIAIHGWSSGTGAAGLVGSGIILILTTIMKLPVDWVLKFCSFFPLLHFLVYYGYLPSPVVSSNTSHLSEQESNLLVENPQLIVQEPNTNCSMEPIESPDLSLLFSNNNKNFKHHFVTYFYPKIKSYFLAYMLPLSLVYFAEYTINQGVAPTMLFPLEKTPFDTFRDSYVAYGTLYQAGVFISRSSGSLLKIENLYLMGGLQIVNLAACILQSLYMYIPNIWIVFALIFYEGLLGGAAYVNTFMKVSERVPLEDREFALGCVGISDSFGIVLAAGLSLWLEPSICNYQIKDGRNWCSQK